MRTNSRLLLIPIFILFLASLAPSDVLLEIEETTLHCNESGVLNFSMDAPGDEVTAIQVDILFDTGCISVTGVSRTERSVPMDIFDFSSIAGGIRLAMTGVGRSIAPGSGPVAAISVDVGECPGEYSFDITGCVVVDPSAEEITCTTTDNAIMVVMCVPRLSTSVVDFGAVRLGETATTAVSVTNSGNGDAQMTVTVDGCAHATPAVFVLASGATREITVCSTPTEEGPCGGTVTVMGCGDGLAVSVSCNGVCSHAETDCPLDFGDVTIAESRNRTITITNPGSADLNISAIHMNDPDFTVGDLPGPIPPGGSADVTVTAAPSSIRDGVTATATILSDAHEGDVTCQMMINKVITPNLVLSIDPGCQVIKPRTPFQIQVRIDQVTDLFEISGIYFELCTDTCIAFFDSSSVTLETGTSVIDSVGWDIKVHYPEMNCLRVWLIGGNPVTENGCLVNIDLVPNAVCLGANGWECGGATTDIRFADAVINEGLPEVETVDGQAGINEGPGWDQVNYVILTREGCIDYGCPPVQETFITVDADGDTMAFIRKPDVNWGAFGWNPDIAPYPTDTVITMGTAGDVCGGASTLEWIFDWCPQKDALHAAGFSAPYVWVDTMVTWSSFTWPGETPCYDTTLVYWALERLDVDVFWGRIESWACAAPEPVLWLCPDFWYYNTIGDLVEPIYSIDLVLGYDSHCLAPYEVGFEDLDTYDAGGALAYTINEEEAAICVSIALNTAIDGALQCASLLYVGFELKTEGESAACTTCRYAPLTIDHVRINEEDMNTCWKDGWIHYRDFTAAGTIAISDPPRPGVPDVEIAVYSTGSCQGDPVEILLTDAAGDWGWNPLYGCTDYCFCVSKPDEDMAGLATANDASLILRSLCNQVTLTPDQQIAADVTCDGTVSAYDAALLLKWVVGADVGARTCIGQWVFKYVGPEAAYHGLPYACLSNLTSNHMGEDFEAALVGDVTRNWAAPKTVVGTSPEVTFSGRKATIGLAGGIYSATLNLVGVTARDVTVPEGLQYEWNVVDGVTRIAVAGAEPVTEAAVTVVIEDGESLELYGSVNESPFAVRTTKVPMIPAEYSLSQNYPNPFNPMTAISYQLSAVSGQTTDHSPLVTLKIYNLLGQEVATLVNEVQEPGYYSVTWDADEMASGVYFYRIEANGFTATKRMVLMK